MTVHTTWKTKEKDTLSCQKKTKNKQRNKQKDSPPKKNHQNQKTPTQPQLPKPETAFIFCSVVWVQCTQWFQFQDKTNGQKILILFSVPFFNYQIFLRVSEPHSVSKYYICLERKPLGTFAQGGCEIHFSGDIQHQGTILSNNSGSALLLEQGI